MNQSFEEREEAIRRMVEECEDYSSGSDDLFAPNSDDESSDSESSASTCDAPEAERIWRDPDGNFEPRLQKPHLTTFATKNPVSSTATPFEVCSIPVSPI